jgi:NAD(P)H-dependent FMN reductase
LRIEKQNRNEKEKFMSTQNVLSAPLKVVALVGSLRSGSYTRFAVQSAARGAETAGAAVEMIDLAEYRLPFADGESAPGESVQRLSAKLREADAVIVGTPEYHGSYTGVLKNALDLVGFAEFEGKVVGLVGVAGGALGGFAPLEHLRSVFRTLHAWVVPDQALVPQASTVFDADGRVKDAKLEERLENVGTQTVRAARLQRLDRECAEAVS